MQAPVSLSLSQHHTHLHNSHHITKNKHLILPLSQIKATREMKLVFATLLLIALVFSTFLASTALSDAAAPEPVPNGFCGPRCGERCAKAGEKDRCLKYCGICCQQCQCVPSGTFGNKSQCPCYMNKKNSKGEPKCP